MLLTFLYDNTMKYIHRNACSQVKKLHVLVVNADAVMKKWSDYSML